MRSIPKGGAGGDSWRHILDLIEIIGRYSLLGDLIDAAHDAHHKMFEPTGHYVVDGYPGIKAARYKNLGQNVLNEEVRLQSLLNTYPAIRHRSAIGSEITALIGETGVVGDARALLSKLEDSFGPLDTPSVDNLFVAARLAARQKLAGVRAEISRVPGNLSAYKVYGTDPLPRLWLACATVMAWVHKPKRGDAALTSALIDIRNSRAVSELKLKAAADKRSSFAKETRQLFFLIRHLFVRDPGAVLPGETEMVRISEATERSWRVEDPKHAGREPFSTTMVTAGNAAYREALSANDDSFLAEVRGPLWVQLRLP